MTQDNLLSHMQHEVGHGSWLDSASDDNPNGSELGNENIGGERFELCPADERDAIISALLGFQLVALLRPRQPILSAKQGDGFKMLLALKLESDPY